jgi:hypothetical protein
LRPWQIAAALVVAVSAPLLAAVAAVDPPTVSATGDCLAWFGSRGDGICLGYSTGNGISAGTPDIGVFGPGYGNGLGVTSGPLLPGQTFNVPIG